METYLDTLTPTDLEQLWSLCKGELELRINPRFHFASKYHRNLKDKPLDFTNNPFLKEIYLDQSPEIVIKKAAQVGISEWLICDDFSLANQGLRIFHVLPTIDLRNNFVVDRVDSIIQRQPVYMEMAHENITRGTLKVEPVDNRGMKTFGKGVILFVGSNSKVSFLSFPADVAVVDELDACDPINIGKAETRLAASDYKFKRYVSNPSVEGYGIDKLFKASDQKNWHIKCPHCGKWQELDFFKNVIRQKGDNEWELLDRDWDETLARDIRVFCAVCLKELERLSNGEWIAVYPSRDVSGYHCSQLFFSKVKLREVYKQFKEGLEDQSKMQQLYNFVLGLAYTVSGDKLTELLLDRCIEAGGFYNMPIVSKDCTMGVDVGSVLHVVISDNPIDKTSRRKVYIGTVRDFSDLDPLMLRYGVKCCVVDGSYDGRRAKMFRDKFPGKVWLCEYFRMPKLDDFKMDDEEQIIKVDRTQSLDDMVASILQGRDWLPADARSIDEGKFYEQMCASTRVLDVGSTPPRNIWTKGIDHYFHANNYERLAQKILYERGTPLLFMENLSTRKQL